jgi:hypothetical protein
MIYQNIKNGGHLGYRVRLIDYSLEMGPAKNHTSKVEFNLAH